MRSLPDRFQPKVTVIEEAKNLETLKIKELIGSLKAFELNLKQRNKEKSIALKALQEKNEKYEC